MTVNETGTNTGFVPMIQLIGPDGTNYGYSWGDTTAQRHITAAATGVYKIVVSGNDQYNGTGHYSLVVNGPAKASSPALSIEVPDESSLIRQAPPSASQETTEPDAITNR